MTSVALGVLAGSVALGYFTIAALVAPRIRMPSSDRRLLLVVRGAAIAFFVGCGLTHVHILVHLLGVGAPAEVSGHEVAFHLAQAVGAWLFIAGAIMRLELHVLPAPGRAELQAAIEEQRRLAEQARQRADRDELTGLARRWRFDEELDRRIAEARRSGREAALALLDVDGLKAVNDGGGHGAGDAVLERVGATLRRELRATDLGARLGGDEFAVVLADADLDEAERAVARIVSEFSAGRAAGAAPASISAGLTAIDGRATAADALRAADDALYAAKRGGGNQLVVGGARREPDPA